jgi:tripartite-type tricarboxylate transporter receptor subunit TctC
LFAPKRTSAAIITKLNEAVQKAMQVPVTAKRLGEIGADIPPPEQRSPEALRQLVNAEVDKWVPLIKAAGIVGQ